MREREPEADPGAGSVSLERGFSAGSARLARKRFYGVDIGTAEHLPGDRGG